MTNEWIDINEELPPEGIACLLYETYPEGTTFNLLARPLQRTAVHLGGMNWQKKFITYENQDRYLKYVTHWMPLPEPPKE